MNDIRKSALWALISIPVSLFGYSVAWGMMHNGSALLYLYIPAIATLTLLDGLKETSEWLWWSVAFIAQYLGYFLLIYVLIKIFRILKKIRAENIAEEQSEKDSPTHLP